MHIPRSRFALLVTAVALVALGPAAALTGAAEPPAPTGAPAGAPLAHVEPAPEGVAPPGAAPMLVVADVDAAAPAAQRGTELDEIADLVAQVGGTAADPIEGTPVVPAALTAAEATALAELPGVAAVVADEVVQVAGTPAATSAAVGAPKYWGTAVAAGWNVAVLDTGVDATHPMLAGKVAAAGCFSGVVGTPGLCPPPGAPLASVGAPCALFTTTGALSDDCEHGTHVAGVAAGNATNIGDFAGTRQGGVGAAAGVVAVQVFTPMPDCVHSSGAPCVGAYTSNILEALTWLHTNRVALRLAAVNMSIAGLPGASSCSLDIGGVEIRRLRDAGIPVVVAAGNSGNSEQIAWPACIDGAVAVAAAAPNPSWSNWGVATFSNGGNMIDVAAPGHTVWGPVPGRRWEVWSGTSMAAPHVAGAAALWRHYHPTEPASAFLSRVTSGNMVDPRNGVTYPRLAVGGLTPTNPPTTTTTTTRPPTTTTTTRPPTTTMPNRLPLGRLDEVIVAGRRVDVRGWAFDPDGGKTPVRVSDNGRWVLSTSPNRQRLDVWSAHGSLHDPASGYDGSFTATSPGSRNVCAQARDTSTGVWVALGCRTVTVK